MTDYAAKNSRFSCSGFETAMYTDFRIGLILPFLILILVVLGSPVYAAENGIFSGRVADVSGNPVAGAEVFVYRSANTKRPPDFIAPPSGPEGEFSVTLPAAHYWTVARLRKGDEKFGPLLPGDKHSGVPLEIDIEPGETLEEEFVIADLEETSRLLVKYDTSFVRVEGTLMNEDGTPLENGYAFANRTEEGKRIPDYVSAWTGSDGKYVLYLPPGEYYFGEARIFPPEKGKGPFHKVKVDSDTKNINIIEDK